MSTKCYWCGDKLKNKRYRRFVKKVKRKYIYGHFCDELCEGCYVFNKRIEKPSYGRVPIGGYGYEGKSYKNCDRCGTRGTAKDFPYRSLIKIENSEKTRKGFFCSEDCLKDFLNRTREF